VEVCYLFVYNNLCILAYLTSNGMIDLNSRRNVTVAWRRCHLLQISEHGYNTAPATDLCKQFVTLGSAERIPYSVVNIAVHNSQDCRDLHPSPIYLLTIAFCLKVSVSSSWQQTHVEPQFWWLWINCEPSLNILKVLPDMHWGKGGRWCSKFTVHYPL
jgi:hypothetical protein